MLWLWQSDHCMCMLRKTNCAIICYNIILININYRLFIGVYTYLLYISCVGRQYNESILRSHLKVVVENLESSHVSLF